MSFSSATFTAPESGTSPAVLTVQLTGRAVKTPDSVLVSYVSTMDDAAGTTAIAGTDYLSKSGDAVSIIGLATTTTVAVSLLNGTAAAAACPPSKCCCAPLFGSRLHPLRP